MWEIGSSGTIRTYIVLVQSKGSCRLEDARMDGGSGFEPLSHGVKGQYPTVRPSPNINWYYRLVTLQGYEGHNLACRLLHYSSMIWWVWKESNLPWSPCKDDVFPENYTPINSSLVFKEVTGIPLAEPICLSTLGTCSRYCAYLSH